MTQIASTPPGTIRARIHDSAIRRVTRIYASTLSDVMTEALQNSRRAGATRVRIAVGHASPSRRWPASRGFCRHHRGRRQPASSIPPSFLSFGENGWSDDLVRREDAAGFGFASLSRRGCTVSSRPRSPDGSTIPGWRVDLAPEHFLGERRGRSPSRRSRRRFRTGRRYRSRPPKPPPRSEMRPRMPPGITRLPVFFEGIAAHRARRRDERRQRTARPPGLPRRRGARRTLAGPRFRRLPRTAIAATTTRTSTSTA